MKYVALVCAMAACRSGQGPNHEPAHHVEQGVVEPAAAQEHFALGTLPPTATPPMATEINQGLAGPETVIVDPDQDVYLVSNVNGDPAADDHNGYVSKISPSGVVIDRYWIDGRVPGIDLSSPRGMVIGGDTLYVVDIHAIRLFDRISGQPKGVWPVPDAKFLDHLAIDAAGHVLATDIGVDLTPTGPVKTGPPTIYQFDADGHMTVLARGDALHGPTGIANGPDGTVVVEFLGDDHGVFILDPQGKKEPDLATLPFGQLDGIAVAPDGSLLVSSWLGSSVYRVVPGEPPVEVVQHLTSPAAIAYDAIRGRILIPELNANKLLIQPWSPPASKLLPADLRE